MEDSFLIGVLVENITGLAWLMIKDVIVDAGVYVSHY
jgi:hypothetical protein